ncbi:ABC transporter ATP-binding protein [Poritiphilus flavus]|uniref:ATP-binding cassette domain-containing protein n=1 Tax=Poritiphilus flavus TaxID=2697053 RepID=A0A6L9EAK7_9FLAO|nr:ABC transporter ATP-binding protein [Poritiphilus flavus]NAS11693.1 ATP-binding cassette domain-containing protein [Poritiphilus flavus]
MNLNLKHNTTLSAEDLCIGYGRGSREIRVVEGLTFSLQSSELVGIVGVNGIGKSTLLRTLGGVQPSLSGNLSVNGEALKEINQRKLAELLSVVLTEPTASGNLTALELVSLGRHPHTNWIGSLTAQDRKVVLEAVEWMQIEKLVQKKCFELSDGQLQRVFIARALAQDTRIILLDEPTTHLDLYHKVQILKLLQRIAHEHGKTILFTTHEIELAIQLCDKLLVLDNEQNAFGTPSELIARHSFEKLFPEDTLVFDPRTASFKVNK